MSEQTNRKWTVALIFLAGFSGGFIVALGIAGLGVQQLTRQFDAGNAAIAQTIAEIKAQNEGITVLLEVPPASDTAAAASFATRKLLGVEMPVPASTAVPRWAIQGRARPVVYGDPRGAAWYYQRAVGEPVDGPFTPERVNR